MGTTEQVNIVMVDDHPAKLLSYEAILADLGLTPAAAQPLASELVQRIGREGLRRHILALWQRRGVAVDRRRAGIDDAPHTRSAGRQEHVLRADEISCQRGRGVDNLELHGRDGRVVEDHLDIKDI